MALVRTATERDVRALAEIYAHQVLHGAATFETEPPDNAEMDRRRLEILSHGLPYLVAELDGAVTGYAYAARYRPRPAYRFTVEDSVYIHPGFLGRGLGRLLLSSVVDLCAAQGCRQMIAVIGGRGNTASIRLHASLGFRQAGVLEAVGRKFGRWIDTVIMQRALAADGVLPELMRIREQGGDRIGLLTEIAGFLRRSGEHRWVGLYEVDHRRGEVRNLAFSGPDPPATAAFRLARASRDLPSARAGR